MFNCVCNVLVGVCVCLCLATIYWWIYLYDCVSLQCIDDISV